MTTREAIAIVREQAAKETGPIREALEICAGQAENRLLCRARQKAKGAKNAD